MVKKRKRFSNIQKTGFLVLGILVLISAYMLHPKFGKRPSGERLKTITQSPNYKNGRFQNVHETPQLTEGILKSLFKYFFQKSPNVKPKSDIPHIDVNFDSLTIDHDLIVWFGHSSYYMQLNGKRILVDPVFSQNASPLPFGGKGFNGTDVVRLEDLPFIDYVFITHDHYDHLDYLTLKALKTSIGKIVCGLGVGEHLTHWGYAVENILEKDWNETFELEPGLTVNTFPARHFTGRSIWTNNTLWVSYALKTDRQHIYIGGDSGYDTHFKEIGEQYGPFDVAILENGQYDSGWRHIHMFPEEVLQASEDLQAHYLFPMHSSKYALANHAWNEPLEKIHELANSKAQKLLTPLIGEVVYLNQTHVKNTPWWRSMKQ